jgi:polar amino acid transport system substrate-binding protein
MEQLMLLKCLCIVLIICLNTLVANDEKIIHIAGDEWCPYNCEEQSAHQGYMVELATEAFKIYGYRIEYIVESSWQEAIDKSRQGEYEGIVGTAKSDAPGFIFPKTVLATANNCFISRLEDKWQYTGLKSLESQRMGVIVDYTYGDNLNKYINSNRNDPRRVQFVSGNRAIQYSLTKVKHGKLDLYVDDCRVIEYAFSHRQDKKRFKIAGKANDVDELYIAFNPTNPKSISYAKMLDDGLIQLKKTGQYAKILKRYGITQ